MKIEHSRTETEIEFDVTVEPFQQFADTRWRSFVKRVSDEESLSVMKWRKKENRSRLMAKKSSSRRSETTAPQAMEI